MYCKTWIYCIKVSKMEVSVMTSTLSADGSPWHPKHPSTEGHHQTLQTGFHDSCEQWPLWKKISGDTCRFCHVAAAAENKQAITCGPTYYLFALIKHSEAKVPSLFMTVCKIPLSMRIVPSACNVTQPISRLWENVAEGIGTTHEPTGWRLWLKLHINYM